MSDKFDKFDFEKFDDVSDDGIREVSDLAKHQVKLEALVERSEAVLSALKRRLAHISETKIPDAMLAMGMSEFKLDTGHKLTVKKFYSATCKGNEEACFNWLRENEHGDIIKSEVKVSFGKGEDEKMLAFQAKLKDDKVEFSSNVGVHHSTLKAFVREQIEADPDKFPREMFKVYEGNKTTIKKG